MSSYRIQSLTMHNFKLFDDMTIQFDSENLMVLDGPNGYGKTSTFDAIEYVITGTIKRVEEKDEINGKNAYDSNFLEKYPSDGTSTYVKATFYSAEDSSTLEIHRFLQRAEKSENNPKKLSIHTTTTVIHNGKHLVTNAEKQPANKKIAEIMGDSVMQFFDQYYYISQEDRFSFLAKSEKDRMQALQRLFNIQNEEEQAKKLKNLKSKLNVLTKDIETNISTLSKKIFDLKKENTGLDNEGKNELVQYEKIMPQLPQTRVWDQEKPSIADKPKLEELQEEIRSVVEFSKHYSQYCNSQKNAWIDSLLSDRSKLQQYLFLLNYVTDVTQFKTEADAYISTENIVSDARINTESINYEKIDFKRLSDILKTTYDYAAVSDTMEQIKELRKNEGAQESARTTLIGLQENMEKKFDEWISSGYSGLNENDCPLCGYPWGSASALKGSFKKIRDGLKTGETQTQAALSSEIDKLKGIYENQFRASLTSYIDCHKYFNSTVCQKIYSAWDTVSNEFKQFQSYCQKYEISPESYCLQKGKIEEWNNKCEKFCDDVLNLQKSEISLEYTRLDEKYDFKKVYSHIYQNNPENVVTITDSTRDKKFLYLEQQYYLSQTSKINQLNNEKDEMETRFKTVKRINKKVGELEVIVADKLKDYKKDIVDRLKVPFYFYTGRIIQNYPGGLGVLLTVQGNDNIRFQAFDRRDHDVFYTLSSGQLSALVISLTLTLNKIYAQDAFRCVLIDDPIQTMDELNISSLVELLRNDFKAYQFILSTHEDDFSDYIRYKFEKYHLSNRSKQMSEV